jgi:hypothetical protein
LNYSNGAISRLELAAAHPKNATKEGKNPNNGSRGGTSHYIAA